MYPFRNYKTLRIKLVTLVLVIGAACNFTYSQTLKYDGVYKQLPEMAPINAFRLLSKYQKQDPHFANVYMQLGNISEEMLKDIDPFRDFEYLNYWANNAVLYYGLFPVYLQSNEARRNRDFYSNIPIAPAGAKIDNEALLDYLNKRLAFCQNFKDSSALIFETLSKSKDHYNNAVRIFNEINNRFDNYNDALLQTNDEYLALLESLKKEHTDCLSSFQEYHQAISTFPLGGYNQILRERPIETFRLDGLINSDILKDTFDVWNYSSWVNNFLETYNRDIVPLRKEVASINKTFADNKQQITLAPSLDSENKDNFNVFDEKFLFRLGRYDNNSLVRELFRYLDTRQDYLILQKSELNLTTDSTPSALTRKVRFYQRLAMQFKATDYNLGVLSTSIRPEKVNRFSNFFSTQYQGERGLQTFCKSELEQLQGWLEADLSNFSNYLWAEQNHKNSQGLSIGTRGANVALSPTDKATAASPKTTHVTQYVSYAQGSPQYVSGYIKRAGNTTMAFVALVGQDKKLQWLREIGDKRKDAVATGDKAPLVYGYEKGCVALVSGFENENFVNTLVRLDNTGKVISSNKLPIESEPTHLTFDEITQQSILVFGTRDENNPTIVSAPIVCQADSVGNLNWSNAVELSGQIVEIVKSDGKVLVFANYQRFQRNGKEMVAEGGSDGWSHMLFPFSSEGLMLEPTPIAAGKQFFVNRVFTLSSTELNLVGTEGSPGNHADRMKYMLIGSDGKELFSNF